MKKKKGKLKVLQSIKGDKFKEVEIDKDLLKYLLRQGILEVEWKPPIDFM